MVTLMSSTWMSAVVLVIQMINVGNVKNSHQLSRFVKLPSHERQCHSDGDDDDDNHFNHNN